ncbi:SPOR domain-containing protein [Methylocella sp.]|uniref:SPOR domain-containing protein n=1 Tax=Methylocella sp. TaxID=1978226 RepID=UPI0035B182F5
MRETAAKQRPMIDLEQFERRLRQTEAGARGKSDPLAELARLPGERDDPYKTVFEPRTPAPRESDEQPSWPQGEDFDYRDIRAPARDLGEDLGRRRASTPPADRAPYDRAEQDRRTYSRADFDRSPPAGFTAREALGAPYDDYDEDFDADPRRPAAAPAPRPGPRGYEAPSYARAPEPEDDFAEHPPTFDRDAEWRYADDAYAAGPDDPAPRSKRPLYVMAAVILLGVGGVAGSFALRGGSGSREVATIKAHDGPVKIQPDNAGADDVRSENPSILERTPQAAPVAVADGAEQPIDLSRMPDRAPRVIAMSGANAGARAPAPVQTEEAAGDQKSIVDLIEPKKVKTVSVRPDGSVIAAGHADAARAPAHAAPKSAEAKSAEAKPAETKTAAREAEPAGEGGYAAQLAAPSSEAEAKEIQSRLIKKYASLIPGFKPVVRKAVTGDKTVYRVRAVGLTKEQATGVCQKVQGAGGACFVARN